MPETSELVINTGPLLALIAALGDLAILDALYQRVVIPLEVSQEILIDNASRYGAAEFQNASYLDKRADPVAASDFLKNSLDRGEAAVIQTALREGIQTVCIDEPVGRRVARLHALRVTGSLGVLLRAKREGHGVLLSDAVKLMRTKGIRLSDWLVTLALKEAGEE